MPIPPKFRRVVIKGWKAQPTKSRDILITWSHEKKRKLHLHLNNTYDSQTWQGDNLGGGYHPPGHVKWSPGHCLLNTLKIFHGIVFIILTF